jgi:hypothetical protein
VDNIAQLVLAALISSGVVTVVLGYFLNRRADQLGDRLRDEIARSYQIFASRRAWEEKSVGELLGPINMHLDRTELAFKRWREHDLFLEANVIRESNLAIRDLLLGNASLIPPDLRHDASLLIEHFDAWLRKYDQERVNKQPGQVDAAFTFVGPDGYPFPRTSADRFQDEFKRMWKRLYAPTGEQGSAT